jgi:hypothetical protein
MIDKLNLVSIISKYHLNGMVEAVRWDIKEQNLSIGFNSPSKEMIDLQVFHLKIQLLL